MPAAQCHVKLLTLSWDWMSAKGLDINRNADNKLDDPSVWQRLQWLKQQRREPGTTWHNWVKSHCIFWVNNGDIIPSSLGMTCLPPWISQRKENLFLSFCWHLIGYVWSFLYFYRKLMSSHPASCSLFFSSFPMGKFKLLKQCWFIFHGKFACSAALVKNILAWIEPSTVLMLSFSKWVCFHLWMEKQRLIMG